MDFKIPIIAILGIFLVLTIGFDQDVYAHYTGNCGPLKDSTCTDTHNVCWINPLDVTSATCPPELQAPVDTTFECNSKGGFTGELISGCDTKKCLLGGAYITGLNPLKPPPRFNLPQVTEDISTFTSALLRIDERSGNAYHPFFDIRFLEANGVKVDIFDFTDKKNWFLALSSGNTTPQTVTWKAQHDGRIPDEQADTDTQLIIVRDTIDPEVTPPPPTTVEALTPTYLTDGQTAPGNTGGFATNFDLCDSSPSRTFQDTNSGRSDPQILTVIERKWMSQDSRSNEGVATQFITFKDTTPPVLTVPSDMMVKCNFSTCAFDIGLGTANDLVDTNPTITNDDPDVFPLGTTVVTWTATDASTNQAASVEQIITVVPDDDDGDGIVRLVDTLPTEFSDDFDDVPIRGETSGTLTSRGNQDILILEETNPDGIFFDAKDGGGDTPATIIACEQAGQIKVDSGDSGTITCGSITISIISGSVDVEFDTRNIPATTTMGALDIITFDDDTLTITNNSLTNVAIIKVGNRTFTLGPGESITIHFPSSKTSYQDPNLGDVRHGEGHDNGFCMNQNCINVDGFFNHFPETIVPQGSTQTFSLLINCPRGVNTCNHASIEGVLPDSDFYDEQWGVTLERVPRSDAWETTINNPYGEIGEVTTTVQEVGQSFLSVSFNVEFLIPGSIGTADGLRVAHENNRFLHVTVWDSYRGISNYIFNEGVYVDDIYAYPKVEASYDAPLETEKLCLNENTNKRYTCAFDKVRELTIKNAEKALLEINGITELDVLHEEFLLKFKELKQAIADENSEKISELRVQLDELGSKIHNQKQ